MEINRHTRGRSDFALMLNDWIASSSLKNAQFATAANDALGSVRCHATQLANLRHGMSKNISPHAFDALGCLNAAAWKRHCSDKLFEHSSLRLEHAITYIRPLLDAEGQAITTEQLLAMFLGHMPCVQAPEPIAKPAPEFDPESLLIKHIGSIIMNELLKTNDDEISAITQAVIHYPSKDMEKLQRIKQIILQKDYFDQDELEDELPAIRLMLQDITDEKWPIERLIDLAKQPSLKSN